MEEITELFKTHSLASVILGWIVICAIGILKYFKVFSKVQNKDLRKAIYMGLNVALSFGFGALYCVIFKVGFGAYLPLVFELVPVALVEYAIYENIGLRKLLQYLGNYIVSVVAKKQIEAQKHQIASGNTQDVK